MFKIKVKCDDKWTGEEFIERLVGLMTKTKTCPIPYACNKSTDESCSDCIRKYVKIKVVEKEKSNG
jgi:hypothetical protein